MASWENRVTHQRGLTVRCIDSRPEALEGRSVGVHGGGFLKEDGPLWQAFLAQGRQTGVYELMARDGTPVTVEYAARANIAPGLHLSVLHRL